MDVERHIHGAVTVLKPKGSITQQDAEDLKDQCLVAGRQTLGRLAIDLSAVPFIDSRGLEILVEVSNDFSDAGHSLRLCALTDTVREVFVLTGIGPHFELFEDASAAARSFL
ncbi:MAG: STAS domain-containing protein [Phycisphaeraceae bacterium]|nr:STAS domain-containing protein [Phycisphaerales bacterium]MCB9860475.1 STAS domain-containing protein [Phycisphaeraceae bacterium]